MKDVVIIFVDYPEPGQVLPGLAKTLGPTLSAELYWLFVLDTLDPLRHVQAGTRIYYRPEGKRERFEDTLDCMEYGVEFFARHGQNPGQQIRQAFEDALEAGYERMVLLRREMPGLPAEAVTRALDELSRCDAVVGPGGRGDFGLVGISRAGYSGKVFKPLAKSGKTPLEEIMTGFTRKKLSVRTLPGLPWIETVSDLVEFARSNAGARLRSLELARAVAETLNPSGS